VLQKMEIEEESIN